MENVWYNNIQKKNHAITILKNQLFVTNMVNQNTFKEIIWFWRFKNYDLNLRTKYFIENSI